MARICLIYIIAPAIKVFRLSSTAILTLAFFSNYARIILLQDVISLGVILTLTGVTDTAPTPDVVFTYWVLLSLLHGRIFSYPLALKIMRDG